MHYKRWEVHGDPEAPVKERFTDPEEAFEARTIPEPNSGCLLWIGADGGGGYGKLRVGGGKEARAHRYAWTRANGPIPKGLEVDHICHTPQCVNVDHLRLATRTENRRNLKSSSKNSKTGVRGVFPQDGKFVAQVGRSYLGFFETVEEAARVVRKKREEVYGEFAGKD